MPPASEKAKAYSRGYAKGLNRSWPPHYPPMPPDAVIRGILEAAIDLMKTANHLQGGFDEDDDGLDPLRKSIDRFGDSMAAITRWLSEHVAEE